MENLLLDDDRRDALDFMVHYGDRLKRRIKGKIGPKMQREFDDDDILATVGRRLLVALAAGTVRFEGPAQFWSLLCTMADHAVAAKARTIAHAQQVESLQSAYVRDHAAGAIDESRGHAEELAIDIEICLGALHDPCDREILGRWLADESQSQIAQRMRLSTVTIRRHWKGIKARLRRLVRDSRRK
jgi:DNA-directed RNA polymerase specialized sigma24 family protein